MKILLLFILLAIQILAKGQNKTLSLPECIVYAITNSQEIKDYNYQISSTSHDVKNEKRKFLPSISAQLNNGITSGFQQVFTESIAGQYETVRAYANSATIDLSVPIWTANAHKTLVVKREIEMLSEQNQKANKELDIKINVIRKFYSLALAQNRYEISLNQKKEQDSILIVTKQLFELGERAFRDVVDAEANLMQNEYDLKIEEYNIENARRQLADIMRMDEMPYIIIGDVLLNELVMMPSFNDFYDAVVERHPAIKCQNAMVESANCDIRYYRRTLMPSISFNYEAGTSGQLFDTGKNTPMASQWKHNAYQTAQISIQIPIFNHAGNTVQLSKARIERDRSAVALERSKQDLRDELEEIYSDMLQAKGLLSLVKKNAEMTSRQYEYAIKDYKIGNMASYELNVYKRKNMEAQLQSIQAEYELRYKYAILQLFLD